MKAVFFGDVLHKDVAWFNLVGEVEPDVLAFVAQRKPGRFPIRALEDGRVVAGRELVEARRAQGKSRLWVQIVEIEK